MKSMYGTRQAAWQWDVLISKWTEEHGYAAVNSEKTIFMKHVEEEWIMHCLYVDDMIHAATSNKLHNQFISEYREDFYMEDVKSCNVIAPGNKIEHNKP